MTLAGSFSKTLRPPTARSREFWERVDPAAVTELQTVNYDVVRASVDLLREAIAQMYVDDVAREMFPYLHRHVGEELMHARWLRDDLLLVGVDVLDRSPSLLAAQVVGPMYYWIRHDHPVALLGYMAILEGCTARPEWVEGFIERTGYPRAALRTLLHHAVVDPGHSADLDDLAASLPLTPRHLATMILAAIHTASLLSTPDPQNAPNLRESSSRTQ